MLGRLGELVLATKGVTGPGGHSQSLPGSLQGFAGMGQGLEVSWAPWSSCSSRRWDAGSSFCGHGWSGAMWLWSQGSVGACFDPVSFTEVLSPRLQSLAAGWAPC